MLSNSILVTEAEEIQAMDLKEGDSYGINCWLTTVTTVRAKKVVPVEPIKK